MSNQNNLIKYFCVTFLIIVFSVILNTAVYADDALQHDINQDGKISISDILVLKKAIISNIELTPEQFDLYDVNDDNKINIADILHIKRLITKVTPQPAQYPGKITGTNVRCRKGPGTQHEEIDKFIDYADITIIGEMVDGWYYVRGMGQKGSIIEGYTIKDYVMKLPQPTGNDIVLNVPDFKQTDSRWRNYSLTGSPDHNIGSIGCLVTALAMSESCRTETTIYPDEMAKKLRFSSSGDLLEWPANYTNKIYTYDYKLIFDQLNCGIPVIVGANGSSQHWVIIYGTIGVTFDENNNPIDLKSDNFLIRDPGSSKRTTLTDFISSFPTLKRIQW